MATLAVEAPMQGTIVSVDVRAGDAVRPGQQLVVIESMKMEHVIAAEDGGQIVDIAVVPGQTVNPGDVLLSLAPLSAGDAGHAAGA
ncbi:MAG: biotin/lipoyl-binding protein, partial [Acidimicrobiia bacterium]|nr:biotin/lipoyl-binding protein [Acidimicrobiia bacterium]